MKSALNSVAVTLLALISCVEYVSSIFCYDCNSAFDPRCGDEFDPFSLGIVNCSLQDPPDHIDVTEPTICRAIKMQIFSYDCNSAFDSRCEEDFDPFSLGVVNCSLQDPPDHIDVTEPTICRAIKMQIYGKVRIVRQCGYITDNPGEKSCQRRPGDGDVFVTYCSCDTDLCNAASTHFVGPIVFVILVVTALC